MVVLPSTATLPLSPNSAERLEEAQRIAAGKAGVDRVDVRLDLRQIRRRIPAR